MNLIYDTNFVAVVLRVWIRYFEKNRYKYENMKKKFQIENKTKKFEKLQFSNTNYIT